MKKLIIILVVFFLSGTVMASNKLEVKIPAQISNIVKVKKGFNFEISILNKVLESKVFRTQVITTFTDDCGITWQVTTTCSCTVKQAQSANGAWIQDHMDDNGCLNP